MNQLQKQILYWIGIVFVCILIGHVSVITAKQFEAPDNANPIAFTGEGKVLAKPDVAVVDLSIVTEAASSKAAQDQNSQKSQALTSFLKKAGVAEKDIKTTGYNIYPQYYYPVYGDTKGSQPRITGYQVNQTVQVKVRDLEKVDEILDGVVGAGVNQVNNLQLTVDNPEALRDQARQKAIDDAKSKARSLANQLDISLGRITNFTENTGGYPVPMYYAKDMVAEGRGGGPTTPSIQAGENEITVSVTLTYQIK